ncbi:MAG: hypothetical protein WEC59_08100 [Salibacteraceae bacterium]
MKEALHHLQKDLPLSKVLEHTPLRLPKINDDVYWMLLKAIVEQQLSTKAAATIWHRFQTRFKPYPHPKRVLASEVQHIRDLGLSFQKAGYIKNIADFAQRNELSSPALNEMNDREVITHLTQIKGVGRWTAEMILMFSLGRNDVFPVDDLIIRNAMIHIYDVKSEKRQLYRDLEAIAEKWSPYRSHACFVLWDYYEGRIKGRPLYGG